MEVRRDKIKIMLTNRAAKINAKNNYLKGKKQRLLKMNVSGRFTFTLQSPSLLMYTLHY